MWSIKVEGEDVKEVFVVCDFHAYMQAGEQRGRQTQAGRQMVYNEVTDKAEPQGVDKKQ